MSLAAPCCPRWSQVPCQARTWPTSLGDSHCLGFYALGQAGARRCLVSGICQYENHSSATGATCPSANESDGMAYHAKALRLANITLLPLTVGSPELNPAEQVWQQLREHSLAYRCYDSYTVTRTSSTPAARLGINSPRSPAPFAHFARVAGLVHRLRLRRHNLGLVLHPHRGYQCNAATPYPGPSQ
jgi:hypothetical protein